ncbi:MAG: winged helix-turn-helix transcriptional regulator [Propionibacteriaceae bacterium]|jgi:ATP-dependent DNA helicase RecG|nr:winged helix-turn-helix transcriptional regulator [Propionibacteriaceae bacterium]
MSFETHVVEWKQSWRDEYLKWICGFANAQGGVLEIGKDDHGKVVGVADARKLLKEIPDKINNSMAIVAEVELRTEDGLGYLVITVLPYPYPISYHGRYYLRSGATNRELTGNALDEFILRRQGKTWDGVPVPQVAVSDLDIVAFRDFRRMALASERLTEADLDISDPALIDSLQLGEGNYLKRAAILLFHEQPERWMIGSYVKIGYFETGADLMFQDEVHGPIITMADKVLDILYAKYFRGMISYQGIQRIETYPVARAALREAVLNAIVHRDYSTGVPIQIKVFPDHLVIYSDGGLPHDWTLEKLLGHHDSSPRNPYIANAFFRSGQIETWGRGIEKIEDSSRKAHKPAPVFEVTASEVNVTFPFPDVSTTSSTTRPVVDVVDGVVDVGHDVVDDGHDVGDGVVDDGHDVVEVADTADLPVDTSRRIMQAMIENPEITQKELARIVGVTERTISRQVKSLREAGLIRRVGSDRYGRWELVGGDTQ